jgi:hypothetical protein
VTWFAWQGLNGGKAVNLSGLDEKEASADGFHGYGTQAEAEANPNSINPITRIEAEAFIPGTFANNPDKSVAQSAANATGLPQAASSVEAEMASIWGKLSDGKMWRSLGWLLLGILLMLAGVALWIGPSAARRSPLGIATRALG